MDFGLFLDRSVSENARAATVVDQLIEQVHLADDAGFDLLTTGQHYLTETGKLQPVPLLSRLAAESESMGVATGILILPLHHPVDVAEQMTTLESIADHLVVGVGAGYRMEEFDAFDISKRERARRLTEGVELLERLWTEEDVTYEGEHYSVTDATLNPRPERKPPIWIAANGMPAIERAARISDAWYVNPHSTLGEIIKQKQRYDEIRRERGLSTFVPILREAFVASSEAEMRAARDALEKQYDDYLDWGQHEEMEDETAIAQPLNRLAQDRFVLGTPEEVCEKFEQYDEELGIDSMIVRLQWPGLSHEHACKCIERFGDEVIPYV